MAAATSSSSTAPSPPTLHPRRFLPALRDTTPREPERGTTSLPLAPAPGPTSTALTRASPTARAATLPPSAAMPMPGTAAPRGLARQGTKRRVIEQDESLSSAGEDRAGEGEGGEGEAARAGVGRGKRRRRVIEQDVTPGGTQEGELELELELGGGPGVAARGEGRSGVGEGGGGEEEEEAEPDTQ